MLTVAGAVTVFLAATGGVFGVGMAWGVGDGESIDRTSGTSAWGISVSVAAVLGDL